MRKSFLLSTTALIVLGVATAASADDNAETVVVTATRIPTPESQVASSMTVITADDIAAKALTTLPDVLANAPGLNIVQTGGPGSQTAVFMRGTNPNHVKVLVDGIDISDPSNSGQFDFGQFLTPDIAKIEILRGPQSGLYGSDAVGGVINIITKSGEGPAQFTAGVEGGSFDTFNQTAGVGGSEGGFHYVANFAHFYSGATPVTPLEDLAPGEQRVDDRYNNVTASTKLGYDVTDNFDLGFVGRYTNAQLHFTGDNFTTGYPDATLSESDVLEYFTRATAHLILFGGFFEQTLGVAYSSTSSTDFSPDSSPNSYFSGDRLKVDWQGNLRFSDDEILVLGAEHQRDEIRLPVSAGIDTDAGYAELQSTLFDDFHNALNARYDSNDRYGDKVTFREAPEYVIRATGTTLKASVGTGFKAPTLNELFENFPSFGFFANPNLRPETSIGWDAGFEQSLFDQVQLGATYFRNDIKNLIDDNITFSSYTNVDKAKTEGVEAFIAYQPIQSVNLRADYTYTEAIGTQPNNGIFDQELQRRPRNKLSLDVKWQATEKLSFDADVLHVSSWIDGNRQFTITDLKAPGWTTADVAVNYAINDMFTVYGRVSNLFDEHYQDPFGFLRPGRGFYAGIKAKI